VGTPPLPRLSAGGLQCRKRQRRCSSSSEESALPVAEDSDSAISPAVAPAGSVADPPAPRAGPVLIGRAKVTYRRSSPGQTAAVRCTRQTMTKTCGACRNCENPRWHQKCSAPGRETSPTLFAVSAVRAERVHRGVPQYLVEWGNSWVDKASVFAPLHVGSFIRRKEEGILRGIVAAEGASVAEVQSSDSDAGSEGADSGNSSGDMAFAEGRPS
jgi:hypothetical protein